MTARLIVYLLLFVFTGCTDTSGLEDDIRNLNNRVDNLESAVNSLQAAMNAGKLVKSVSSDEEGWTVTFSDNTSIYIISREGLKSAVPRLSIDETGYWMVSYDGNSYIYLLDNSGNRVQSTGKDGLDGKDGQDGKDGLDGKDGQDGKDGH
ncbi:MAG: DUF4988 domain-containing protein, partial [Muribaculaceae bacterium]|nr:DUF4988 domain-containing protein [Muribaculaceae bacterium]